MKNLLFGNLFLCLNYNYIYTSACSTMKQSESFESSVLYSSNVESSFAFFCISSKTSSRVLAAVGVFGLKTNLQHQKACKFFLDVMCSKHVQRKNFITYEPVGLKILSRLEKVSLNLNRFFRLARTATDDSGDCILFYLCKNNYFRKKWNFACVFKEFSYSLNIEQNFSSSLLMREHIAIERPIYFCVKIPLYFVY